MYENDKTNLYKAIYLSVETDDGSLGAGLYSRLASTHALSLGGLEMASRRGFWLTIDVLSYSMEIRSTRIWFVTFNLTFISLRLRTNRSG